MSRPKTKSIQRMAILGIESASDTDDDGNTPDSECEETADICNMFAGNIGANEIEVWEGSHIGNKVILEVRFLEGAELSVTDCDEGNAVAVMHRLGH